MVEVLIIAGKGGTVCLDVCTNCYFIWFDPLEFESLPKLTQRPSDFDGLSDEAKKALALARLEILKQEQSTPDMAVIKDDVRWQIALDAISVLLDILLTP
jgi:hypothetical protein